jgi:2-hydroxychromene-2-carboxylate isomerase
VSGRCAIEFFFGAGSRYSYLASTQLETLERETGRLVQWRPLYSGDLFEGRGADPFQGPPVSGQYDWAYRRFDAECWADYYGVPFREPDDLDFEPRRLALACTAASRLGAVAALGGRLFRATFVEGVSPIDDRACARLAAEAGLDAADFARVLAEPATEAALAATLDHALAKGVFGVPSFVVDGRVFFGNDRLPLVRHFALKPAVGNE